MVYLVLGGLKDRYVDDSCGFEIDGGDGVGFGKRLAYDRTEDLSDGLFVFKFDFGLGGVDVDINTGGVECKVEVIIGHDPNRDHLVVGLHHRFVKIRVAHVPAVDKEILLLSVFPDGIGAADEAGYTNQRRFDFNRQEFLVHDLAGDGDDALFDTTDR